MTSRLFIRINLNESILDSMNFYRFVNAFCINIVKNHSHLTEFWTFEFG